jgi:hypothetical protein
MSGAKAGKNCGALASGRRTTVVFSFTISELRRRHRQDAEFPADWESPAAL